METIIQFIIESTENGFCSFIGYLIMTSLILQAIVAVSTKIIKFFTILFNGYPTYSKKYPICSKKTKKDKSNEL